MIHLKILPKRPLYFLLPVVAITLALWAFWPRAQPVEIATVMRAPLTISFSEEGRTRLQHLYRVSVPVDGFVQRIMLEPGDDVRIGTTLAIIRAAPARLLDPASLVALNNQWQAAEQTLVASQAALAATQAESDRQHAVLVRAESLAKQQLISADELELARTLASTRQSAEQAAIAKRDEARALRDGARDAIQKQGEHIDMLSGKKVLVKAPSSGQLLKRFVESEGPVQAGQPLMDIGNPVDLEIEVDILSTDAVKIAKGTQVELTSWGGDTALSGRVRRVEPGAFTKVSALGVEEQRTRAIISFDTPPASHSQLGDGYRIDVRFLLWQEKSVLQVPIAALFREGEKWAVYSIEHGRAQLRYIRPGRFGESNVEVLSGLDSGANVIVYPGDTIRDGVKVAGEKTTQ